MGLLLAERSFGGQALEPRSAAFQGTARNALRLYVSKLSSGARTKVSKCFGC